MKIGIIRLGLEIVVDLDNEYMVERAMDSLAEDIHNLNEDGCIQDYFITKDKHEFYTIEDIPEWLMEECAPDPDDEEAFCTQLEKNSEDKSPQSAG